MINLYNSNWIERDAADTLVHSLSALVNFPTNAIYEWCAPASHHQYGPNSISGSPSGKCERWQCQRNKNPPSNINLYYCVCVCDHRHIHWHWHRQSTIECVCAVRVLYTHHAHNHCYLFYGFLVVRVLRARTSNVTNAIVSILRRPYQGPGNRKL